MPEHIGCVEASSFHNIFLHCDSFLFLKAVRQVRSADTDGRADLRDPDAPPQVGFNISFAILNDGGLASFDVGFLYRLCKIKGCPVTNQADIVPLLYTHGNLLQIYVPDFIGAFRV